MLHLNLPFGMSKGNEIIQLNVRNSFTVYSNVDFVTLKKVSEDFFRVRCIDLVLMKFILEQSMYLPKSQFELLHVKLTLLTSSIWIILEHVYSMTSS